MLIHLGVLPRKLREQKNGTHISKTSRIGKSVTLAGGNYVGGGTELQYCDVGYMTYFSSGCDFSHVAFGKYCSIGPNCQVMRGKHPTSGFVSTCPAFYTAERTSGKCYVRENKYPEYSYVDEARQMSVLIGNDVWLAANVTIVGSVTIGDGAIVGAGAVITKDVPPYAIVGGVPAKVIRYRFSPEQIQWLLNLKWWDQGEEWIQRHADCFEDIDLLMRTVEQED